MLVGKDDNIVPEYHEHIGELLRTSAAVPHVLVCMQVGERPEAQKRATAKVHQQPLGVVYAIRLGNIENALIPNRAMASAVLGRWLDCRSIVAHLWLTYLANSTV
ncbi:MULTISPECIES: hypothetical protein [Burkholderia cepacia complex]|uniref:hypothetical protein n=1 Tax=Burkholderia cepacia complex TaxID=87882 RepID=UPI0013DDE8B3|nr:MULTISPECIES: hypothetical protein [Burkholderia cepacia complex]